MTNKQVALRISKIESSGKIICPHFERDVRQTGLTCKTCGWNYDLHLLKFAALKGEQEPKS